MALYLALSHHIHRHTKVCGDARISVCCHHFQWAIATIQPDVFGITAKLKNTINLTVGENTSRVGESAQSTGQLYSFSYLNGQAENGLDRMKWCVGSRN